MYLTTQSEIHAKQNVENCPAKLTNPQFQWEIFNTFNTYFNRKYTFFSKACGTFIKIDYVLNHKGTQYISKTTSFRLCFVTTVQLK